MNVKMNVTINKNRVTLAQAASVKEQIKEFQRDFSAEDLLNIFEHSSGIQIIGTILACDVEAFRGRNFSLDNSYLVHMTIDQGDTFTRIHMRMSQNGEISEDAPKCVDTYKLVNND